MADENMGLNNDFEPGYGRGYGFGDGDGFGPGYGCGFGDGSGYNYGDGSGYGSGYSSGSGSGSGYGYGYGAGYIYGDGYGSGYSSGSGSGSGYGYDYGDGYGYNYGDGSGYGIQKELLSKFKNAIKPELILKETNVEYRMQLIELVGVVRLIQKLGAKIVEKGMDHCNQECELLNFNIIDGTFRPYLKLINPSTKTCHIEGVHPSCDTIEKALRWRNKNKEKPNIIT